jgi:hypothetical protein
MGVRRVISMKRDPLLSRDEVRKFLSFTIANPDVPIIIWFWGILIKSLTIIWLVYVICKGTIILIDHGPPEPFLIVLFQATAATILYFLGDGLCHGERSAVYGMGALCLVAILIAFASGRYGYHLQMGLVISAILLVFIPPIFSGFRNLKLLN